ncbi:uncharacterized protein LOC101853209 [Aplysia californica]|uniref:Uncharacterized protein LOC101853209 n=1 Tax=Aplysia californica TaxID=6500 RepID=A0ABM0K9J3_APLCA|nr:uncharacterized protein LOC101853209 [Aplysia californica]
MSSDSNNPCSAVVSADDVPAPANTTTATAASIALTGVNNKNGSSTIINRSATTTTTAPPQTTTTLATATTTTTATTTAAAVAAATTSAAAPSQSTSSSTTTNNTLSPFDLSGLGMGFGLYRPRRPSYTFATKCNRQRNESYRHATRRENLDSTSEPMSADGDFIEDVLRSRTRKISYIKATKFSEEYGSTSACGVSTSHVIVPGSDGDDDDDYDDDDDVLRIEDGTRGGSQLSVHSRTSGFETIKVTLNNHSDNILTNANNDEDVVFCESQNYLNHKSAQNCPSLQGSKVNSLGRGDSKSTGTWRSSRFKLEGSKNVSNIISTFTFHKNVIVLCCSFILVFSSFQAIQNLQSSMNSEGNLGIYTMMSVHIAMIFSCLVSPIIINLFTAKWALCIGIHCFLIWFGANFHPTFYTLIPTSMFVGLGKGILWSAENAYVLRLACESSRVKRTTLESEMFRFHGIFLACFQTTHIWGNLISSLVLSSHAKEVSPPMSFPDMGGADGSPGYEGEGADGGVAYPELPANQSSSYYSSYDRNYEGGGMSGEMPPMLLMSQCGALHRCGKAAMTIFPGVMQGKTRYRL